MFAAIVSLYVQTGEGTGRWKLHKCLLPEGYLMKKAAL